MKRINYKSDFKLQVTLSVGGEPVGVPSHVFTLLFGTTGGGARYCCGRGADGQLYNCKEESGKLWCLFDRHGLGWGVLTVEYRDDAPDADMGDGVLTTVTPSALDVELVSGAGDGSTVEAEVAITGRVVRVPAKGRHVSGILHHRLMPLGAKAGEVYTSRAYLWRGAVFEVKVNGGADWQDLEMNHSVSRDIKNAYKDEDGGWHFPRPRLSHLTHEPPHVMMTTLDEALADECCDILSEWFYSTEVVKHDNRRWETFALRVPTKLGDEVDLKRYLSAEALAHVRKGEVLDHYLSVSPSQPPLELSGSIAEIDDDYVWRWYGMGNEKLMFERVVPLDIPVNDAAGITLTKSGCIVAVKDVTERPLEWDGRGVERLELPYTFGLVKETFGGPIGFIVNCFGRLFKKRRHPRLGSGFVNVEMEVLKPTRKRVVEPDRKAVKRWKFVRPRYNLPFGGIKNRYMDKEGRFEGYGELKFVCRIFRMRRTNRRNKRGGVWHYYRLFFVDEPHDDVVELVKVIKFDWKR